MSGRTLLSLLGGVLFSALLVAGFLLALNVPAQAWTTKGTSCSASSCHGGAATATPAAVLSVALNGTPGTSITVAAGATFEVDWMYTNMVYSTSKYTGTAPELAVPTGWTVAAGTANSPSLTGWSSTWDAADGVSWNVSYSTAAEFPNSPAGYSINYNGTAWDNGNRNCAFDNGSVANPGDRDGVANKMGADARITVPAGTAPGTYTVMVLGVGHNESDSKAHIEQAITVTVPDTTAPTVTAFTMPATAGSLTVSVTSFTATDLGGVTGYKVTESATAPLPGDAGWTSTAPTSFTFSGAGTKTAYAWAKDAAGNVSTSRSATVNITILQNQATLSVTGPSNLTYGSSGTITYTGGSGTGAMSYGQDSSTGCTVNSSTGLITVTNASGTCVVTATKAGDATYNPTTSAQYTVTLNKADQATVNASAPGNASYGQAGVSASATGGSGTGAFSYSAGSSTACTVNSATGALTITAGTGTCDVTATRAGDNNYNVSAASAPASLSVGPAALTVTAAAKSKTYGAADPALTYTATGFKFSDTTSIMTGALTRLAGENVGNYAISQGTLSAGSNYTISYTGANLSIDPATLAVTAAAKSKTYGATDPAFTYTATGYQFSDTSSIMTGALTRTAGENVGTYAISQGTLSAGSNYTISYTGANLGIDPATLSVTAAAKSKSYGATDPAFTYTATGYQFSDNGSIITGTLTRAAGEGVGIYAINQGTLAAGSNYAVAYTGADLTISPASLMVSAQNASRPYGTANPAFTPVYSGFVLGDTAAVLTGAPELTTTADVNSPVGSYPVNAAIGTLTAANYTFTFGSGTLSVDLASQTIVFNPLANRTYGSASFDLTATGGASGNPVTYASSNEAVATVSGATVTIVGSGTTTITANQAGNSNYGSATAQQNLTVDKAPLIVSAQNVSRPYNTANPAFTPAYSGFVNGDTAAALIGAPDLTTTATPTSPVGSYPITASAGTLAAANYAFTFGSGTLGIDVATQTITFDPLAARTYGDSAFDLTATGGDSGNPVTFASSNEAVATVSGATVTIVGAGSTTITASQAGNGNYASATAQQTLAVGKAALSVSAQPAGKVYGSANPPLIPAYSGFVLGDTAAVLQGAPDLTTAADVTSPVGDYPVTVSVGNLFAVNYSFTYAPGTLTVTPATLTVTADDQTKTQGATNPPLTFTYSGFLNGDTFASLTTQPTATTTAIDTSPAGTYPITVSGGSSGNYTFTYVAGILTVNGVTSASLGVTTAGTGIGSVHSTPGGISCASGSGSGCSATYDNGTPVSLLATPDWKSLFVGWGGACTGNGDCSITLTADASVTATFDVKPLVRQPGTPPTYFATIQDAYDQVADGVTLHATNIAFTEDLTFNRPVTISLIGGYDDTYSTRSGMTTLHGKLDISNGGVTIDGLEVMQ